MSGVAYFRDQLEPPDPLVLFPREDPTLARWCTESRKLWDWGQTKLVPWVAEHPTPETIRYAHALLEDRYWLLYRRVEKEHRRDEAHADHSCLHQAWLELRIAVEDTQFTAPIPKLVSPQPVPPASHRVIEADEPFDELPGILDEDDEDDGWSPSAAG
jgi:hypothetical protein